MKYYQLNISYMIEADTPEEAEKIAAVVQEQAKETISSVPGVYEGGIGEVYQQE